jgi:hypothetical protein
MRGEQEEINGNSRTVLIRILSMRLLLPQRDNTKILGKPSIGLLTI